MEDTERNGRDVIHSYIFRSLESYGNNGLLVARQLVNLLKGEVKSYPKVLVGKNKNPENFRGAEGFNKTTEYLTNNFVEKKIHGKAEFLRPDKKTLTVKNLENCTYGGFPELCLNKGHKGCIFCPFGLLVV